MTTIDEIEVELVSGKKAAQKFQPRTQMPPKNDPVRNHELKYILSSYNYYIPLEDRNGNFKPPKQWNTDIVSMLKVEKTFSHQRPVVESVYTIYSYDGGRKLFMPNKGYNLIAVIFPEDLHSAESEGVALIARVINLSSTPVVIGSELPYTGRKYLPIATKDTTTKELQNILTELYSGIQPQA